MSRPPKPKDKVRSQLLQMRLTESEYKWLEEVAKKEAPSDDSQVSVWARNTLLKLTGYKPKG